MNTVDQAVRCRCACGASYTSDTWGQLAPACIWATDDGVLELRICRCGSTISAPFSHQSSRLATVTADQPVRAPQHSMVFELSANRFQAWCACMRTSPLVGGTPQEVSTILASFGWHVEGDTFTCPVCAARKSRPDRVGADR